MPIAVVCPGCSAKLNAPDGAAGKKVKCPKCAGAITIPAPSSDFEVVEDEPAPPPKKPAPAPAAPAKKPVKAVVEAQDDAEEDEKPKKKPVKAAVEVDDEDDEEEKKPKKKAKAVVEEDDEDDKPKKKKAAVAVDDDDEDDDKPKKKKKKRKDDDDEEKTGTSMTRNIVGVVVLILALGMVFFVFKDKIFPPDDDKKKSENTPPSGGPGPNPPGPGPGANGQVAPLKPLYALDRVAISPSGTALVIDGKVDAGKDPQFGQKYTPSLRLWRGGKQPQELQRGKSYSSYISAFSPDGQTIATFDGASDLKFLRADTGELIKVVKPPAKLPEPTRIAFTSDGTAVVYATADRIVTVGMNGSVVEKMPRGGLHDDKRGRDSDITFVPALNRVARVRQNAEGTGCELALWNPATDDPATATPLEGGARHVVSYAVSGDGKSVAVSVVIREENRAETTIHSLSDGKLVTRFSVDQDAKNRAYQAIALSVDGRYFAGVCHGDFTSGDNIQCCDLVRVQDGKRLSRTGGESEKQFASLFANPIFSAGSRWLVFVWAESKLIRVDTEKGAEAPFQ